MKLATLKRLIKESNLIEGISDPKEIKQSLVAWDYLADQYVPLTHGIVRKVQKIITLNQEELWPTQRGYYRDLSQVNVRVGSYYPPDYPKVPFLMADWLESYADMTPFEAHAEFEAIHPFVDGNGRTGRMLWWWDCLRRGKDPVLVKASERHAYYAELEDARS